MCIPALLASSSADTHSLHCQSPCSSSYTMTFVSTRAASMSSGLLLDPMPPPETEQPNAGQRFRPYLTPNHQVTKGRYITSNDPRGYIPVYEYPLNGQWIMLDMDDGYVLWTGIWKALGNSKADIVKMVESQPDLASKLRRVRGGYLKIQGTWMPYEIALRLARRVAWPIRHELIPLFGPTFPTTCLSPDQPGFGQVVSPGTGRRRTRRTFQAVNPPEPVQDWTVISPVSHAAAGSSHAAVDPPFTYRPRRHHSSASTSALMQNQGEPVQLHMPYAMPHHSSASTSSPSPSMGVARQPMMSSGGVRYSPYPTPSTSQVVLSSQVAQPITAAPREPHPSSSVFSSGLQLPPIQTLSESTRGRRHSSMALPPISALEDRRSGEREDSASVLRRLQAADDDEFAMDPNYPRSGASHSRQNGRLPPMRTSFTAHAPSSPPLSFGSSQTSSINSPSSPSLVTPISARSSFDDGRIAHHSQSSTLVPAEPKWASASLSPDYPGDPYRGRLLADGLASEAAGQKLESTSRSWRPW